METRPDPRSAAALVDRQLRAYNAHDLDAFLSVYSDAIRVHRSPALEPVLAGKDEFARFYATQRFNLPALRAEVLNRIVLPNCIIDHERIDGVRETPFEVAAAYTIADELIASVWFFSGD